MGKKLLYRKGVTEPILVTETEHYYIAEDGVHMCKKHINEDDHIDGCPYCEKWKETFKNVYLPIFAGLHNKLRSIVKNKKAN